jgi:hypothetical protein
LLQHNDEEIIDSFKRPRIHAQALAQIIAELKRIGHDLE